MHGLRRELAHFEYINEMLHPLQVSGVMPSKKFFSFNEHSHGLDPLRMLKRFQAPGQGVLNVREIVAALEGIAAPAWRARDLAQLRASLASSGRQVIRTFRHFTGSAQAPGYFFGFFFIHNPSLSQSLQAVKLGRLNPDSLWAGPPAWELEDLFFFCFFFNLNFRPYWAASCRARLAARSACNCENVLLIKKDHIFFSKVLSEPVQTITYFLPFILVVTEARFLTCLSILLLSHMI